MIQNRYQNNLFRAIVFDCIVYLDPTFLIFKNFQSNKHVSTSSWEILLIFCGLLENLNFILTKTNWKSNITHTYIFINYKPNVKGIRFHLLF